MKTVSFVRIMTVSVLSIPVSFTYTDFSVMPDTKQIDKSEREFTIDQRKPIYRTRNQLFPNRIFLHTYYKPDSCSKESKEVE